MVKSDDISSTERLLDVIRDNPQAAESPVFSHPVASPSFFSKIFNTLSFKKSIGVGAEIEGNHLYLAKAALHSDKKAEVTDFRSVPIDPEISKDRNQLIQFLNNELVTFCPPSSPVNLWIALPPEQVDIRCLRLPKISKGQIANAVYWTYQKETSFDKDNTLLDFDLIGETIENGVPKLEALVCTAPRQEVEELHNLFSEGGFIPAGISANSFAIQNFLRTNWIAVDDQLVCCLSIGTNWSRIDVFRPSGDLIVSRGIKAGMTSMIESIKNEVAHPTGTISMPTEKDSDDAPVLELPAFDKTEADQILEVLNVDATSRTPGLLKSEDVFEMILPALERLIRQVERTLEHVTLKFSDGPVQKLLISGAISAYPRLVEHINSQLSMPCDIIEPFSTTAHDVTIPSSIIERTNFTASIGFALAGNAHTPNFLFTHKEESHQSQKQKFNQLILAVLIVGAVILGGYHIVQKKHHHQKIRQIEALEKALTTNGEKTEQDGILQLASEIKKKHRKLRDSSKNYLPVAAIGEVASLAPPYIRYIRVDGRTSNLPIDESANADDLDDAEETQETEIQEIEKDAPLTKTIIDIDGIVYGTRYSFESRLARYLIELKQSPLFHRVILKKKMLAHVDRKEVLRFTVQTEMVSDK